MPARLSRRTVLAHAAGAIAAAGLVRPAFAALAERPVRAVPYGVSVHHESFWGDPRLRETIAATCDQITIENALKMDAVLADPERYDFSVADTLAGWAIQNGIGVHGHTLVWYGALPEWVNRLDTASAVETLMARHIDTLVDQYRHVTRTWDVVNEAIPDYPDSAEAMRDCVWLTHLGRGYVAEAFTRARAADPSALLVLNEYDIEFAIENGPAKREAFRQLILRLLDAGAPLDAVGFQAHLRGGWPIATEEVAALVSELRGYGLEVLVTELDVIDTDLPADVATRDRLVAEQVDSFLGAIAAGGGAPRSITTWGLTDQHSWIRYILPRGDGLANRPLPLDWDYNRKPFADVLDRYLGGTA